MVRGGQAFDIGEVSSNRLPSEPISLIRDHWEHSEALVGRREGASGEPLNSSSLAAPVPHPPMILCVVANFPPTRRPELPMVVAKAPTSVIGPFDDVVLPDPSRLPLGQARVIPEPELAVVARAARRHLSLEEAQAAIAGFTVAQDITERTHEFGPASSPWTWENLPAKTLGKSFDSFCPMGPVLVTPDELADLGSAMKRCWINDKLVFEHSLGEMLWNPAELVSLISRFMTMPAGLVILCGSGGTTDRSPIPFLRSGDEVRTEIEGIGTMVNRCRLEQGVPSQ